MHFGRPKKETEVERMDKVIELINNQRTPQTIPEKMALVLHRLGVGRHQIDAAITFLEAKLEEEEFVANEALKNLMSEPELKKEDALEDLKHSLDHVIQDVSELSVIDAMPLGLSGVGVLYNTCFNFRNKLIAHRDKDKPDAS